MVDTVCTVLDTGELGGMLVVHSRSGPDMYWSRHTIFWWAEVVPALFCHNPSRVLGYATADMLQRSDTGIRITAKVSPEFAALVKRIPVFAWSAGLSNIRRTGQFVLTAEITSASVTCCAACMPSKSSFDAMRVALRNLSPDDLPSPTGTATRHRTESDPCCLYGGPGLPWYTEVQDAPTIKVG
jgi:hypothetical protein